MTLPVYTITNSQGATLTTIKAGESNGPGVYGYSSPQPVVCRPEFLISAVSTTAITNDTVTIAGNFSGLFQTGYSFYTRSPIDAARGGPYTVGSSSYSSGTGNTTIVALTSITATAATDSVALQVFLVNGFGGNQTARFVSGFTFTISSTPSGGANTNSYTTPFASVYDSISGYTVIPLGSSPIIPTSAPLTGASGYTYTLSYVVPPNTPVSSLALFGYESANWGIRILENLIRMNENYASPNSPDTNTVLSTGGANAVPQTGQLWYNTTTGLFNYYNGTAWANLSNGLSGDVPSTRLINTGAGLSGGGSLAANLTLTLNAAMNNLTDVLITTPTTGQILRYNGTKWANFTGGTGTVTSVNATGGTGVAVTGGPITASGTLSITLSAELQGLSNLASSSTGFVQRTGAGTYTAAALTSTQVKTALGYTPLVGNQTITISGDATGSGTTAIGLTLASVLGGGATVGNSLNIPVITFDGKGRAISAANIAIPTFSSGTQGLVPASGGGTTNYLRADGTFANPINVSGVGSIVTAGASSIYQRNGVPGTGVPNQPDPTLQIVLVANAVYEIVCNVNFASSAGIDIAIGYTGAFSYGAWIFNRSAGGSGGFSYGTAINTYWSTGIGGNSGSFVANEMMNIRAMIYTTTAGTLYFGWGQASNGSVPMQRLPGSLIRAIRCA